MSGKVLFVIEAPGKIKIISNSLREIGLDADVAATCGHILGNPDSLDPIGVDSNYHETMRGPIDRDNFAQLEEKLSRYGYILIATDPDQEGDVIASDVANMVTGSSKILRVRMNCLDPESIQKALEESVPINHKDSLPGTVRRVLDRVIGAALSVKGDLGRDYIGVGRVQSALLGLFGSRPQNFANLVVAMPAEDNGQPFIAEMPVNSSNYETAIQIRDRMHELLPAKASGINRAKQASPWNFGEAVVNISERVGVSVTDASNALQDLYERGLLSYPRTSGNGVSISALDALKKIAGRHGLGKQFDGKSLPPMGSRQAHEALRPVTTLIDVTMPLRLMSVEDASLSLITRNLLVSGMAIAEEVPDMTGQPAWARQLKWSRIPASQTPWVNPAPEVGIIVRNREAAVIESMVRNKLGRPSTQVQHAVKFVARDLVDNKFSLTERGHEWLGSTPKTLASTHTSAMIETMIDESVGQSGKCVSIIVNKLGDDVSGSVSAAVGARMQSGFR